MMEDNTADTAERAYMVATAMAEQREKAIRYALDCYFMSTSWTDEQAAAVSKYNIYSNGEEGFEVSGMELIRFGRIVSKVDVIDGKPLIKFSQTIHVRFSPEKDVRVCKHTGDPVFMCRFDDVGIPVKSEYEPDIEHCQQVCRRCNMIRFVTREADHG